MPRPDVSVILPVRNGSPFIRSCLEALQAQTWPAERTELIVVDNGSTDDTRERCRALGVEPVLEPRPGASRARNRGLALATADVVAFTDADCVVPPEWLEALLGALGSGDAVAGWLEPSPGGGRFARCRAAMHRAYLQDCRRLAAEGRLDRLDTANAAIRRDVFDRVGSFRPEVAYVEDRELAARIVEAGRHIAFDDGVRVEHQYENRLLSSLAKARGTGRAWVIVHRAVGPEVFARRFPDLLTEIDRMREEGRLRRRHRLRLEARLGREILRCFVAPGRALLGAYARAETWAIRLGMHEALRTGDR